MDTTETRLEEAKNLAREIQSEIGKIIIGQEDVIKLALVTLICKGHALIEGAPGVAKTLLISTIAATLKSDSKRLQFTPDLMPSDITGTNVFNFKTSEFTLIKGPVFTSFLLADEINRSPAKTQAALLQAMQERIVSIDGKDYSLDPGFTVFATQNPIEHEGTYQLPEAQKDRFLLQIDMEYPEVNDELSLIQQIKTGDSPQRRLDQGQINGVCTIDQMRETFSAVDTMEVSDELAKYMVTISRKTREHEAALLGGGPRATMALLQASRAWALLEGRDFTTPDDVKLIAPYVLKHRILLRPEFELEGMTTQELINSVFESTSVPR